jgi:hypothetical protein
MRFYKILLSLIVFITFLNAQNYLWPTNASKYMTSSFCEFRPRHYHAAIDIKTWQQTGYKIFAIEDGYVYRIRVASTGYGKAIYIKLKDGNIAVYAHLKGFTPELDAYTDSQRLAAKNNILDMFPNPNQFPVKKGDLLGYTGGTGIGVPHLHFELRDSYNRPINPLQFYKDTIQDDISPKARFLAIIPAGSSTFINFEPDTLILPVAQQSRVKINNPVYLTGKAYLALRTYDLANKVNNRFDFYKAEMFINGKLGYKINYDRFSYDETRLIEIDKNFSLWRKGLRVYHNFYRHPANSLPFYGEIFKGSGLLHGKSLQEGKNTIQLKIYDYFGNLLEIEIPVIYHRIVPIRTERLQIVDQALDLEIESMEPLQNFRVQRVGYGSAPGEAVPRENVESEKDALTSHYFYRLTIPNHNSSGSNAYQIRATYADGLPTLPLYVYPNSGSQNSAVNHNSITFTGDRVIVKGRGIPSNPAAVKGESVIFIQYKPEGYYISFPYEKADILRTPLGPDFDLALTKEISGWTPIFPGRERVVRSEDGVLRLHFPSNAVYDTLYTHIRKIPARQNLKPPYRFLTDIYNVRPFDQPLNYGANITFTLPNSITDRKGAGVYYFDRRRGWLFLPSRYDAQSNSFNARVTSLEKFAVIKDTVPPEIRAINLTYSSSRPLEFYARDELAGIYKETQISVKIDGKWSLFEFDPETDLIHIHSRYISPDARTVAITVFDNAGNKAVREFQISANGGGRR